MRILITGATGFLGGHLIKECLNQGHSIIAFGRNDKVGRQLQGEKITFVKGDFTKKEELEQAFQMGIDKVVHAGALSTVWGKWQNFYQANVVGTQHVLDLCQKYSVERLVFVSSPSIYAKAEDQNLVKENQAPTENHLSYYIKSKLMAEQEVMNSGLPYVIIRPRGLFGIGDTIKDKGKIVVATESEFAPFEFKSLVNGKDTLVGADINLARAIGDKLGVDVEFSVMSFNNVLSSLQSGKADIAIAGISVTDERKNIYDFSDSYYESENVVIVKKSDVNTYASTDSLAKKSIGAQKGSVQETAAKEYFQSSNIVSLTSNGEMINELKSGQLQAVILEKAIAEGYISQNDDLTLAAIHLKSDETDAYAVAVPKGSDELLKQINQVISEVKTSGQFDQWLAEASTYTQIDSSKNSK